MRHVSQDIKPHPGSNDEPDGESELAPGVALRRHTDRCFFAAEEIVTGPTGDVEGYVVEGVLIPTDEVAEVRPVLEGHCNDPPGRAAPPADEAADSR